jgi:cob(I)alamin adenosyltransferase
VDRGYVQIYTGEGKGKTTAALGLALRAAGAGLKVFIGQFLKGRRCSEHDALERFGKQVTVRQYGRETFVMGEPDEEDIRRAREGMAEASEVEASGLFDVVILDEVFAAVKLGLIDRDSVADLVRAKHPGVELVLTGREAPTEIVDMADLVSDIQAVKHYHDSGVPARKGIEY